MLLPALCMAQKDRCNDISRNANPDAGTVTWQSPYLKHLSVLRQTAEPAFFALHVRLSVDYPDFDATGLTISFDDGTSLYNEAVKIDCKEEAALVTAGSDAHAFAGSGKYVLQAFFYITPENAASFTSKKIVKVQLHDHSQKIPAKEAEKIIAYVQCLANTRQ